MLIFLFKASAQHYIQFTSTLENSVDKIYYNTLVSLLSTVNPQVQALIIFCRDTYSNLNAISPFLVLTLLKLSLYFTIGLIFYLTE